MQGSAPPALPPSDAKAVEAAWKELQATWLAPGFSRSLRGVVVGVASAELKSGRIFVKLKCSPAAAGLPVAEVRDDLAGAAPAAKAALLKNDALDNNLSQIDLRSSIPCIKE